MSEFFYKKVRIEDNGLISKGRVIVDNKIVDGIIEKNGIEEFLGDYFCMCFLYFFNYIII